MTVGQRIKKIRGIRGLTQKELGMRLGFPEKSADIRMAQYESGTRKPKKGLLTKMADVLEVRPEALEEPNLESHVGVMHALFALEDAYGARVSEVDGNMCLIFDRGLRASGDFALDGRRRALNGMLREWRREAVRAENGETTRGEYNEWRFDYPMSENGCFSSHSPRVKF
jgi:transcriptional regulator with XRE-family HTH domain